MMKYKERKYPFFVNIHALELIESDHSRQFTVVKLNK